MHVYVTGDEKLWHILVSKQGPFTVGTSNWIVKQNGGLPFECSSYKTVLSYTYVYAAYH